MEPNVVDLRYFKLWFLLNQILHVWNIKGLHHLVAEILGLEHWSLWQKIISLRILVRKIKTAGATRHKVVPVISYKFYHALKTGIEFLPPTQFFWSLQPHGANLWYFKHVVFDLTEITVWNIKSLRHLVPKIKGLENLKAFNLWW